MRIFLLTGAVIALASGVASAQTSSQPSPAPGAPQKPLDLGPNTSQSNSAFQGGGVVLQGAPGAPAPSPQATPPGQAPNNAVKP